MRNTSAALHWTFLVALLVSPDGTWAQTETAAARDEHAPRVERIENGLRTLDQEVMIKGDPTWTLEERMEHYGVPGVGIAVIHKGKVVWHRTYGVTDRETGTPVKTDTLFQAGSVSKPVAAFGALKLVQDGKLTLDGNVNDKLKSWTLPDNEFTKKKKVNLTHLLSHTGGLTVHGFPGYAVGTSVPNLVQVLDGSGPANTPPIRVDKEPGGSARYSGGGFTVAQQLMIDVSGKPFPKLMQASVLGPLGMTHSTYENPLPASMLKHAAAGYLPDKSPVEGKRHTYPEMAAAGLWTTAEDLARFAVEVQQALRGKGKVLSEAMARRMVEPVDRNVARGLMVRERTKHVYFSHGGWDEGFCAQLTSHRDDGYGVAVMINSNHPRFISEVVRAVAEEYSWGGYHAYEKTAMPDKALETYPGRYRYSAEQMFTIQRQGNRLFLEYAGNKPMEMVHIGDGRFIRREKTAVITLAEDEGKPILHFALDDGSHQSHRQMPEGERALRELVLFEPYEQALAAYRAALKANPEEESLSERELNSWGLRMHEQGEFDGAIALLKINTELYSDSVNTNDSVGYVYRQRGQFDQALQWYRKALEVDPDYPSALKAIAELEAERTARYLARTRRAGAGRHVVTVRALIDGSDLVKVRGNTVWFEHINHALPGAWVGDLDSGNEPTLIDGVEWVPQWDGRISNAYTAEGGLPAERDVWVVVLRHSARGRVLLVERPCEANDYTFTMMLDDDVLPGAAWYEVELRW
jgi:CubicO group peptidase (beta-lactamase class C family)